MRPQVLVRNQFVLLLPLEYIDASIMNKEVINMQLTSLLSDGMVLQRKTTNLIWGCTNPNEHIKGTFDEKVFQGTADEEGYFELALPELPAGGPYVLTITADETRTIQDVMVGDVFLLGGQSNMELPLNRTVELFREELAKTDEPDIRMFEVPKEYDFLEERQDISKGNWIKATGEDLYAFSAAGYFTAKDLKDRYGIPIGLMQTAVGGTPAKSWCSEATIRRMGYYIDELNLCKKPGYTSQVEEMEQAREQQWYKEARESFEGMPLKKGTVRIPGIWREDEFANFHGTMRLTKQFYVNKDEVDKPAEIILGTINDADVVYINGTYVGETGYKYPPRFYPIPQGVLKEGVNTVEIHLSVYREHGGFMPGKQYCIRLGEQQDVFIGLGGDWEYELMKPMQVLPNTTFFTYYPAALYNGMLSPVRKWNYKAFLFYQGESNTTLPERYAEEMEALISDWRALFRKDLPFIYVQLAGFSDGVEEGQGTEWAIFRECQERTLAVENTAMIAAYDIGEYNDLHPLNKKTLGQRIAIAIRKMVYGEEIIYGGPKVSDIKIDDMGKIHIHFTSVGTGLSMRGREICEVEMKGATGGYYPAHAVVNGEELVVDSARIKDPKGVRYAWRDCPMNANLYNKEGLPALPFCREWE